MLENELEWLIEGEMVKWRDSKVRVHVGADEIWEIRGLDAPSDDT